MAHEQLITFLKKYGSISDTEKQSIEKYFIPLTVKKKQVLIKTHFPCNKLYFVKNGLLRAFYSNEKGNEITRMIAWENRFLTNLASFNGSVENNETIECIKDAEILHIDRTDFSSMLKLSLNLKSFYADILEEYNAMHIRRFESLNTHNLEMKFKYLKHEFPHLINQVNNSLLASFLGVSREAFVRNKNSFTN